LQLRSLSSMATAVAEVASTSGLYPTAPAFADK
jgi:hypothetical protein